MAKAIQGLKKEEVMWGLTDAAAVQRLERPGKLVETHFQQC